MRRYFSRWGRPAATAVRPVQQAVELVELVGQGEDALPDRLLTDQIGGEQAYDALVQHAREADRLRRPLAQRGEPLVGQRVVGARMGAPRLLA